MKTIKNLTADEIRKSILQLAIQGKLVKQDPNDEPASELVKRIYEEKHRLIKEGKIKKDKNESYIYKGDDNCYYEKICKSKIFKLYDLPFEIPSNWTWIRLSSFCNIYTGDSINEDEKSKKYHNISQGFDYIGTKDVNFDHTINYENGIKIPFDSGFKKCPKRKILLCIEGGSAGRKIAFTHKTVCFGNKLACFNSWKINDRYLYLFLQSPLFLKLFKDNLTGIISGVSINNLKQLYIPLPPISEQERIVRQYAAYEPLISHYEFVEHKLTNLESAFEEQLKASILQYAIEGKLVKQDPNDEPASVLLERIKAEKEKLIKEGKIKRDRHDSEITVGDDKNYYGNIPANWSQTTLKEVSKLISRGKSPKYTENMQVPVFAQKCNQWDGIHIERCLYISYENLKKYDENFLLKPGDIVINSTGGGTVGRTGFINQTAFSKFEYIVWDTHITVIRLFTLINAKFVFYFLISPYIQQNIESKCEGSTNQIELYPKAISNFLLPLPPKREQERIVSKIETLFSQL